MRVQKIASLMLGSAVAGAAAASAYWIHFYDLAPQEPLVAVSQDDPAQGATETPANTAGAAAQVPETYDPGSSILGELTVPVSGIARDQLTDSYYDAREDGARLHEGIDILAPAGTAVVAAAPGRIEKLFTSEKGGITVYVRSADKRITYYYAHLAGYALGLREGMPVRANDTIGYIGSSGDADPGAPHLHFEILRKAPNAGWSEGQSVNPYPLLVSG